MQLIPAFKIGILNAWISSVIFLVLPFIISSDGSKIVFSSNHNGTFEIYIMNTDGTEQVRLTNNLAKDGCPTFSH